MGKEGMGKRIEKYIERIETGRVHLGAREERSTKPNGKWVAKIICFIRGGIIFKVLLKFSWLQDCISS